MSQAIVYDGTERCRQDWEGLKIKVVHPTAQAVAPPRLGKDIYQSHNEDPGREPPKGREGPDNETEEPLAKTDGQIFDAIA